MERFNEEKYRDAMDTVHASTDLIEKTKGLVSGEHKSRNRRKRYRRLAVAMGTVAAIFCIVMTVPHTSVAKYAKNVFHGFWSDKQEVSSSVRTGIFEDEDEHVKVSVEELLSDEMYISAVVKYQAKDKEGKEWLRKGGMVFGVKTIEQLSISDPIRRIGGGATELEEYRTDSVRYYIVQFEAPEWAESMKHCVLQYTLPNLVRREAELDTSANVPVYEYALKAEGQQRLSGFYEPKVLRLTKLTMGVYGKDTGMSVKSNNMDAFSDEYLAAEEKEELKFVQLIKKDGSYVPLDLGWHEGGVGEDIEDRYQCDCLVTTSALYVEFVEAYDIYSGDRWLEPKYDIRIDPEEITGLSISNGRRNVVYQLEKLK
ncbi:MAG: hypothetical protein K2K70_13565 [Lachnospiraceae bacterium]|nr:hypothetical protein [Lachnospiraceae bacterium]